MLARCAQTGYALRILRAHDLNGPALWNITRATLISKLIYASPAWFGFLDVSSKTPCQGIIQKLIRTGYLGKGFPSFAELCERMMSCSETSKQTITMFSINSCLLSRTVNIHCDLGFILIKSPLQKIMPFEIITYIECCIRIFINISLLAAIYLL